MVQLGDLRRAANLTQAELAERAGLSEQTIYKLENGLHVPGLDSMRGLAEVVGDEVFRCEFGWKRVPKLRGRPRKVEISRQEGEV
jgi:transcriptional regulator with XRE-family HTH domain